MYKLTMARPQVKIKRTHSLQQLARKPAPPSIRLTGSQTTISSSSAGKQTVTVPIGPKWPRLTNWRLPNSCSCFQLKTNQRKTNQIWPLTNHTKCPASGQPASSGPRPRVQSRHTWTLPFLLLWGFPIPLPAGESAKTQVTIAASLAVASSE